MRHRFHSMCPYFAMFPETFARHWIEALTKPGDLVVDPFAGRGTAPLEALLLGRDAVASDINPVAACLNAAKLAAPARSSIERRLCVLRRNFDAKKWTKSASKSSVFFRCAFSPTTLAQLLYLRDALDFRTSRVDAMLSALVLGALHGETKSSRYLSNQMPRTISTKPAYSVRFWTDRGLVAPERDAFEVLRRAIEFRYESPVPDSRGRAYMGDIRDLPRKFDDRKAQLLITSPPYKAVTSYEEDQWLRLWFLGGPETPGKSRITRDDRHSTDTDYWRFIGDFWRVASGVVAPNGHVVVRIGATKTTPEELGARLKASTVFAGREVIVHSIGHSEIGRRQTDAFRPGTTGCVWEVDLHVQLA